MMMYEVRFKIDYEQCSDEKKELFVQEYNGINYHKHLQEFRFKASKMDFSPEEALIFELLCDVKKDLLELKDIRKDKFIALVNKTHSTGINYEQIQVDAKLDIDKEYYCRLMLEDRVIACFTKAIDENILKITKIKRIDETSLEHFVADTQRNLIYMQKGRNGN